MADKYLDHGLYTYSATPTWGVAQEGDGVSASAATPATVAIDLSAATATAGATFSIMGATLTCVASGASTNQFNAGSGATLVSNLVTAINRTTNTSVCAGAPAGFRADVKVQDAVFARAGSPTTTLEIMTRAGSAAFNASQVAISGFGAGPYTLSGGASGAWGWLFNPGVTIWPSAVASYGYGAWAAALPIAGQIAPGDTVNVRAAKTVALPSGNGTPTIAAIGSDTAPVRFLIHDGSTVAQWAGDADYSPLVLEWASGSTQTLTLAAGANAKARIDAPISPAGVRCLKLRGNSSGISASFIFQIGQGVSIEGVDLDGTGFSTTSSVCRLHVATTLPNATCRVKKCRIAGNKNNTYLQTTGTSGDLNAIFDELEFDNDTYASVQTAGVITNSTGSDHNVLLNNPVFKNFVPGSKLFAATGAVGLKVVLRNPTYGGVTQRVPLLGNTARSVRWPHTLSAVSVDQYNDQDFFIDSAAGAVEWNSARVQPVLNATLLDGVTKTSWRVAPPTIQSNILLGSYLEAPRITAFNSLGADGDATITLEFCAEQNMVLNKSHVSMAVEYMTTDGTVVALDSFDLEGGALTTSSVTWTNEVGGQPTYDDGGLLFFNKYKLTLQTLSGKPLKAGTEIGVYFRCHTAAADATKMLFIDPYAAVEAV